jgi:arsenate reductase (thioredoxin)
MRMIASALTVFAMVTTAAAAVVHTVDRHAPIHNVVASRGTAADGVQAATAPTSAPAVMFVCEHGAAMSLIATAYFNKMAAERGLPFHAMFRGTAPQEDLSVRAVAGLHQDGIPVPSGKPTGITDDDVTAATHIFAIGCTLPTNARQSGKSVDWSDVPDNEGYGPMRDAIVRHVTALLDTLEGQKE